MRLLIVTDAWLPQTNGVVTTLLSVRRELKKMGVEVGIISPDKFPGIPGPYPNLRLALPFRLPELIERFQPDGIFVPVEGPLGHACRYYCLRNGIPFATAFTTRWNDYFKRSMMMPLRFSRNFIRWFHEPASSVLVTTKTLQTELAQMGVRNTVLWSRGVEISKFKPMSAREKQEFLPELPRPLFLYVGRVALEKSIEEFLDLDLPGTKVVVGDGPQLEELRERYPEAAYLGRLRGQELSRCYASCDVFVFPSRTDTFGLVILEALSSGIPVVAYNSPGPRDVLGDGNPVGLLARDPYELGELAREAWSAVRAGIITSERCRAFGEHFSWRECAERLLEVLPFVSKSEDLAVAATP